MKKILFLILFFASLASFGQVYDYQVQAADILQSDNYFVWKGDTIRKDSIAYLDNHIDSIRVKYINGQFSKWIANSEKIRQWIANNHVSSIAFSGTTTKTLTLNQVNGGTKTAMFTDLDQQTLSTTASGNTRTITISGGNSVGLDVSDPTKDPSITNEGSLSLSGGTATSVTINSNTSGSTPITLKAAGINTLSVSGSTVTITATEVDGSVTNEIQAPTLVGDNIGLTQTTTTISISGKEDKSNKVTSISGSSTDVQYPSAKLVYDQLAGKEPTLTKGNLTESITGLQFNNTRQVIGGSADLSLTPGYLIPTTVSATSWDNKAPSSNSSNYIWNGTTTQTANYNITGNGIHGGYIQATTAKLSNLALGYLPSNKLDGSGLGNSTIKMESAYSTSFAYGGGNKMFVGSNDDNYITLQANRNPGNGVFTDVSRAASQIVLRSDAGATSIEFGVGASANTFPSTRMRLYSDKIQFSFLAGTGTRLTTASSDGTLGTTVDNSANWNTAYSWGNWASNFGTAAGTIAQGNDSRINNGQTAYGWGNHASAGYATQSWVSSNFDKYGWWSLYVNDGLKSNIGSAMNVGINQGEGLATSHVYSGGIDKVTTALNFLGLPTIVNPTGDYYMAVNGGSSHTKITLTTLKTTIGSTAGTANLNVIRDGSGDAYAHNFILSSDLRLKKNIIDLPNTDWTNKIQFKQFQFKDDPKEKTRYGVIAQDVEKIAPQLVSTDSEGNKAVAYIDLLIAKIAELEKRIKILENESFKNR